MKGSVVSRLERVRALELEIGRVIPYLFPHLRGWYRGQRIKDFREPGILRV
jgi:hypothetical protein